MKGKGDAVTKGSAIEASLLWPAGRPIPPLDHSLPAGTAVVSAGGHWLEPERWVDRIPPKFRDRHPESTIGSTAAVVRKLFNQVGDERQAQAIVGGTAMDLYSKATVKPAWSREPSDARRRGMRGQHV